MGKQSGDTMKYVGRSFPVHDAEGKAKGVIKYTSDLQLPNMLYAKLFLSPIAHGIIKKINTCQAENLPGVVRVFTYLNSPHVSYSRTRLVPREEFNPEDQYLFTDRVRFVGDRVAAVVAVSPETAQRAVCLIEVEYEELPVLTHLQDALAEEKVKIHPEGNLVDGYDFAVGKEVIVENSCTVESITRTAKVHHAAMEPAVCIADFDSSGKLTIWTPTQGVYGVRTVVADLLGLKYHMVRVVKTPTGGSFGGRQEFVLEPVTAFLAMKTGRPVKLLLDRKDTIIATYTRAATATKISTAGERDGRLLSCLVDSLYDAGAYATSSMGNAQAMSKKALRLYRIPYYRHRCRIAYTNTLVAGGMRGWGAVKMITALEIHMDRVARVLGMDPVELRLHNLVHPGDPDPISGISLGQARVIECLEKGASSFHWQERKNRQKGSGRIRRGVGVACGAHKNGMYGGYPEYSTMTLKMNEDGSFILNTGLHELGCGTVISHQQIVAEILDVNPVEIKVLEADTDRSPYDFGSYGSRVTYICGACALKTAEKMKEKILCTASAMLKKPVQYLTVDNGTVMVKGQEKKKVDFKEIAVTANMNNQDMIVSQTYYGTSNPGVYGAHFAEVEVDTLTGLIKVTDFLAAHDIGRAINPSAVEGQIQGGVQMGIGYALCEEINVTAAGKVVNNSFRNYHLVNAPDMPNVQVLLIEGGGDDGPFGAKSVGEIAAIPPAAAVVNAVNDALGTDLADLPLTPEKIINALISKTSKTEN